MLLLILSANLFGLALSGLVKYDQTQTGDYNLHLDLKNVGIQLFLDDSSSFGEQYDYDYGELTLKPPEAPSNSSTSPSPETSSPFSSSSSEETPNQGSNSTGSTTALQPETTTKPHRRCGAGFYRDVNGRCRRLRKPIKLGGILQQATNKLKG